MVDAAWTPPGWPAEVAPPGSCEWESSVTTYLLGRCPADVWDHPVLQRHPIVLARFTALWVEAQLHAGRQGLAQARVTLGQLVPPDVLAEVIQVWYDHDAALQRRGREIALIEQALRGKTFVSRW